MRLLLYILVILFSGSTVAQGVEEELGFLYVKAKYLLETNRYEDAVQELNKILQKKIDFEDALLLRAEAKYKLGAYTGVRKDLMTYIEERGINAQVCRLMGMTDYQSKRFDAALSSITLALSQIKDDRKLWELSAKNHEDNGALMEACKSYKKAAELGSSSAASKVKTLCGGVVTQPTLTTSRPKCDKATSNPDYSNLTKNGGEGSAYDSPATENTIDREQNDEIEDTNSPNDNVNVENDVMKDTPIEEVPPVVEEIINTIVIDEELSIQIFGEGLGKRKILDKPNIVLISDDTGIVALDICVSKSGRVLSVEFDNINSTLKKSSLVNLAIRKAKEFWFGRVTRGESCGKMVFQIEGL